MLLLNIAELLSGGVADELCASRFKETKIGLGQMTKEPKGGDFGVVDVSLTLLSDQA